MKRVLLASLCAVLVIGVAWAQQPGRQVAQAPTGEQALPQGFKTMPVLKSAVTASKQPLAYPQGKAEVVSVVGELQPGGRTSLHQHPVPVYVYILEGTLTVQAQGMEPREYKPGQAFLEDVNHWHQAFNKGSTPAKILVVFVGEEGKPTTVNAK